MDHDLEGYKNTAEKIAREVGDMVKKAYLQEKSIELKESVADLVTETDKAVEDTIISSLSKAYPTHKFIGEETVSGGKKCEWTNDPTWIIDPIDGTSNFVHSIPFSCVCIGLSIDRKIVVGIVFVPMSNEMFTAVKGQGTYLNGVRISVSNTKELKNAVVYCEGGNARDKKLVQDKVDNMRKVILASHGIRCLGSAAYNMCMVAQGCGDAYVEYGIHIWDIAASGIIVAEAGGVLLDPSGNVQETETSYSTFRGMGTANLIVKIQDGHLVDILYSAPYRN